MKTKIACKALLLLIAGNILLTAPSFARVPSPTTFQKLVPQNQQTYQEFLLSVNETRSELSTRPDESAATLYGWIHDDMAKYWANTGWDFNGVSRTPGTGDIACGYFVTTILLDLGFEIDRIRLAQAPSSVMIKELTAPVKVLHSKDALISYVKTQPTPAIYIVGLDFHTGFISNGPDGIFFFHSNYIGRAGVTKENAATSEALAASNYFMIGNVTANKDLLAEWVKPKSAQAR